ncbi:MAG TPA: hypothetical protein ENN39_03100 [Desulfonatronum sp.]|nr:hypothetical protein [Desulfonatronum sp.]
MVKRIVILMFVVLFASGSAQAMNLSSSDLEKFIKTYHELIPFFDEYDDDGDDDDCFDVNVLKERFQESVAGRGEMQGIIRNNTYSSVEEFSEKAAHILRAYAAYGGMEQFNEFEKALATMSPSQQQQFKNSPAYQMLAEAKKQLASVPESHIQAVVPFISQLDELFEE